MKNSNGVSFTLEDAFEMSANTNPIKHRRLKKTDRLRKEMSQKMNREIHEVFQTLATGIPVLKLYTIHYDNSEDALNEGNAVLTFSITPENRLYALQMGDARTQMEEMLSFLVTCCPDEGGMKLKAQPSIFTYEIEYRHNSLIDALYNFVQDVMEPNKEVLSHIFLAGHILDRIENYKPACKLN